MCVADMRVLWKADRLSVSTAAALTHFPRSTFAYVCVCVMRIYFDYRLVDTHDQSNTVNRKLLRAFVNFNKMRVLKTTSIMCAHLMRLYGNSFLLADMWKENSLRPYKNIHWFAREINVRYR